MFVTELVMQVDPTGVMADSRGYFNIQHTCFQTHWAFGFTVTFFTNIC